MPRSSFAISSTLTRTTTWLHSSIKKHQCISSRFVGSSREVIVATISLLPSTIRSWQLGYLFTYVTRGTKCVQKHRRGAREGIRNCSRERNVEPQPLNVNSSHDLFTRTELLLWYSCVLHISLCTFHLSLILSAVVVVVQPCRAAAPLLPLPLLLPQSLNK